MGGYGTEGVPLPWLPTMHGYSRYHEQAEDCFHRLCAVARQTGALLLTEALDGRQSVADHLALERCRDELRRCGEDVRAVVPDERSRHHHHHLLLAIRSLDQALRSFDNLAVRWLNRQDPLPLVRAAVRHLEYSEGLLPGFHIIDSTQSCCEEHVAAMRKLAGAADHGGSR